jgi:hypothetical protein
VGASKVKRVCFGTVDIVLPNMTGLKFGAAASDSHW